MQPTFSGGELDGFIAQLTQDLSHICYATYYGGSGRDLLEGIHVGTNRIVYFTGLTGSRDRKATLSGSDRHFGGLFDAMIGGIPEAACDMSH